MKRVPFHAGGTSMRYCAAPMLPKSGVVVGDGFDDGLFCGTAPLDDEQAASSRQAITRTARLTSDVGPRLPAVDGDARAVEKARLLGADERDHAGHLLDGAESLERHLGAHERSDSFGVRLLPPVPP